MKRIDENQKKIIRIIMTILFIVIMIFIIIISIPIIKMLRTNEGRQKIEDTVNSFGALSFFIFIGVQLLQIVVAFIPGEPIEILGGILFGALGGLFLCLIGILIGTVMVFYLVKFIGSPLVEVFASNEKIKKIKLLNDEKRLETLVFVLFLIPGTPKDALTYVVPLTKIKPSKYFIYSTLARIPSVVTSTMVGANLGKGHIGMSVIIFIITICIGLVGILYNDKISGKFKLNKNKK